MANSDSTPTRSKFDVEKDAQRLDLVVQDLANLKGQMEGMTTKKEGTEAKLIIWQTLIPVGAAIGAALLISGMNAAIAIYAK